MTVIESHEPWLGQVPADWGSTRIRNVAGLSPGYSNEQPETNELCTVVPMEKLSDNGLIDASNQQLFEDVQAGLTMFEDGDVLFAKITPCMENGKGAFVNQLSTDYAFGSTEFHVLRPRHEVNGKFLYYATFNPVYRAYAAENMTGAAGQKRVSSRFLKDTRLFLPPLPEQKLIATYLDASCAVLDAAVAAKRRQIETLEELWKTSITRAVTLGLVSDIRTRPSGESWIGEIPDHWSAKSLKRLISEPLKYGLNEAAELKDRDLPRYIRITDFDDEGTLRDDTFRSLPWDVANEAMLQNNDILFARSGATIGKTFMFRQYDGDACFAGYLIRARTLPWKLDPLFLYFYTKSFAYEAWKKQIYTQATIQNISAAKYNYLMIPVPPLNEQKVIISFIIEQNDNLNELSKNIRQQIDTLLTYRRSLIHECVTGQRRVTEADVARVRNGESGI